MNKFLDRFSLPWQNEQTQPSERSQVLLSNAETSDQIRENITSQTNSTHPKEIYYQILSAFTDNANFHHQIGDTKKNEGNDTAQLRTEEVSVGYFDAVKVDEIKKIETRFFQLIDKLLNNSEILTQLSNENKVKLLSLVDSILTLSHFPIDGSGRTNEEFLIWFATQLELDISISNSGFRGQLDNSAEKRVENSRQNLRDKIIDQKETTAYSEVTSLLSVLESITQTSNVEINKILQEFDQGYIQSLIESFTSCINNEYLSLPKNERIKKHIGIITTNVETISQIIPTLSTVSQLEDIRLVSDNTYKKLKKFNKSQLDKVKKSLTIIRDSIDKTDLIVTHGKESGNWIKFKQIFEEKILSLSQQLETIV